MVKIYMHSVIIVEDELYACGNNKYGQLGMNKFFQRNTPTKFNKINHEAKFVSVSCGFNHTVAIDYDGNIWCNGDRDFGQLGFKRKLISHFKLYLVGTIILSVSILKEIFGVLDIVKEDNLVWETIGTIKKYLLKCRAMELFLEVFLAEHFILLVMILKEIYGEQDIIVAVN